MSLLILWIATEKSGQTSSYIMSDSRISMGKSYIDTGRKLFAAKKYPEIFGFVGEAFLPQLILSQTIDMIDSDLLFDKDNGKRLELIHRQIYNSLNNSKAFLNTKSTIQIIHITRLSKSSRDPFKAYELTTNSNNVLGWKDVISDYNNCFIKAFGSGAAIFYKNKGIKKIEYSRDIFHFFIDALEISNNNSLIGGPPQLVGLYKSKGYGINYGIIYKNNRYFLGQKILKSDNLDKIEWRNENFEICDGNSKQRKLSSTLQPRF